MASSTKQKNIRLFIVLLVLIGVTSGVLLWNPQRDQISVDRELFSVADTASIDRVTISDGDTTHTLSRVAEGWQINNAYPVESSIAEVLLSLIHDVRVFRPVSDSQSDSVRDFLNTEGYQVQLFRDGEILQTWQVGGSERTSTSYFMQTQDGQPYLVHLPGYRSYLAGLFQMPANDWRDRALVDLPYTLLSSITLDYTNPALDDVVLESNGEFFGVRGVEAIDTGSVVGLIQQFQYFQTDYYINEGDFARFDSLAQTKPVLQAIVTPLNEANTITLSLWPLLPGDQYRLGRLQNGQLLLLEDNRIRWMFLRPQDFAARPQRAAR